MSSRYYTKTIVISTTKVEELFPSKGARTYILIDNISAGTIRFDYDVAPPFDAGGIPLDAGIRYELFQGVPQNKIYLRGNLAADQRVNITEGYE